MAKSAGDPAVDIFLRSYPPGVRAIALAAREVIRTVLPTVTEKVYPGWKVIQYGTGQNREDVFAVISPQRERVNLGLANGAALPDPLGLLEGTGVGIRHIKIASPQAAEAPAVRDLVEGALRAAKKGA